MGVAGAHGRGRWGHRRPDAGPEGPGLVECGAQRLHLRDDAVEVLVERVEVGGVVGRCGQLVGPGDALGQAGVEQLELGLPFIL